MVDCMVDSKACTIGNDEQLKSHLVLLDALEGEDLIAQGFELLRTEGRGA
jgi:hypothetical protein